MVEVWKEFGIIGLGRMGRGLVLQSLNKGIRVVGFSRKGTPEELIKVGLKGAKSITDFKEMLSPPRKIFIYIPAGPSVDSVLDDLSRYIERGDVIVDGGNSYWGDSIRRHRRLIEKGIHFVDAGTSGGVEGALHGACFMVGGDVEGVKLIQTQ